MIPAVAPCPFCARPIAGSLVFNADGTRRALAYCPNYQRTARAMGRAIDRLFAESFADFQRMRGVGIDGILGG